MEKVKWSYSSIKTFDQCPKKYYHLRVAKDVKEEEGDAIRYGNAMHKAAELYVKSDTPLPSEFKYVKGTLDSLKQIPGAKLCEVKLGVTETRDACGFFAKDVWLRTIADLVILQPTTAYVIDYKTSKSARYADTKQLDLVAGAVFTHYPQINTVKSALAFVVSNDFVQKEHKKDLRTSYLNTFEPQLDRLRIAHDTGVWNAVDGPLCAYCPVTSCPHNRSN